MKTYKIIVELKDKVYPIYIGKNLLVNTELLKQHITGKQAMIVTNDTIAKIYLPMLQSTLHDFQCDTIILPDGEQHKTLQSFHRIIDALAEHHHHRDTTLIALGGGVIGDVAGFAAACYQRGIAFIQVPTSLLAQVDASIGGKTAINHPMGKNLIGAFHQPQAVFIDIDCLKTLPKKEFNSGIAEIIKVALIKDANFFTTLEKTMSPLLQLDTEALISTIQHACKIKRDIVIADEKEKTGTRALLNLGHTFAHAIEHELGYGKWLHGEAVAVGIMLAAKLSHQKGWISAADVKRIEKLLQSIPLPVKLPTIIKHENLWSAMQMDKKAVGEQLRFVLLKAIGHATLTTALTKEEVTPLLQH